MSSPMMLDVEKKLAADQDGDYRMQLIARLKEHRDQYVLYRQGLLPPEEYRVAEAMEAAITAALELINALKPANNVTGISPNGNVYSPMMNT